MDLAWSLLGKPCPWGSWAEGLEGLGGGPLPLNTHTAGQVSAPQRGESSLTGEAEVLQTARGAAPGACASSPGSAKEEAGAGRKAAGPQGPAYP